MKYWFSGNLVLFCFIAVLTFCCPVRVGALNKAEISKIEVVKGGKDLEASFRLLDCFSSDMEEAILDGVPTTFKILVALEKPAFLINPKVADLSLRHTIKYNRLNNEFQVDLPEHPQKSLVTRNFDEAKRWMSTVEHLPIAPTSWLEKEQEYCLRVKAELSKVELPLFLRYILFWLSLWDFETEWHTIVFVY